MLVHSVAHSSVKLDNLGLKVKTPKDSSKPKVQTATHHMNKMPLTAFVSRLRTGSQGFSKEQQSSSGSSVSVQQGRNGALEQANEDTAGPQHERVSSEDIYAPAARLESTEDSNQATNNSKNDHPLTLRKRFFSRTASPKIQLPIRPMTSGNAVPMNVRLDMLKPNEDLATLLQTIESM